MNLLIDDIAALRLAVMRPVNGETRCYWLAEPSVRCLVVVRHGLDLHALVGAVVDAQVGWDMGYRGTSHYPGRVQLKVTVYAVVGGAAQERLSALIASAPGADDADPHRANRL